ncbi:hypothetical protein [Streptomyces sioyaensis]|uniref:hypothetical protein n=1 Tax=Streptomyces sioyaensis TaxID=67364 RepID=UPI0037B88DCD
MTVHEDLAEGFLEDFQEEPAIVAAMLKLRKRHINGEMDEGGVWSTGYADALGSSARFRPANWPLHQHAAFFKLHSLIGGGEVAYTCISTGGTPGPDADREGNAALLAKTHPAFAAELDMAQNGADSDGALEWSEPLRISRPTGSFFYPTSCQESEKSILACPASIEPGWAPLEVGDSWASRTLLHLWEDGAVARWPYGSSLIWLFINCDWGQRARAGANSWSVKPASTGPQH